MLKLLPIGIQRFRKIVGGGYLYANKTRRIYDRIRMGIDANRADIRGATIVVVAGQS
jgi:hypothetical protein